MFIQIAICTLVHDTYSMVASFSAFSKSCQSPRESVEFSLTNLLLWFFNQINLSIKYRVSTNVQTMIYLWYYFPSLTFTAQNSLEYEGVFFCIFPYSGRVMRYTYYNTETSQLIPGTFQFTSFCIVIPPWIWETTERKTTYSSQFYKVILSSGCAFNYSDPNKAVVRYSTNATEASENGTLEQLSSEEVIYKFKVSNFFYFDKMYMQ